MKQGDISPLTSLIFIIIIVAISLLVLLFVFPNALKNQTSTIGDFSESELEDIKQDFKTSYEGQALNLLNHLSFKGWSEGFSTYS